MYLVAPVTDAILYVSLEAEHTSALPAIVPGVPGVDVDTVTAMVRAELLPQALFAVTDMVPPVVLGVTLILLVVELPVQPVGNVQV